MPLDVQVFVCACACMTLDMRIFKKETFVMVLCVWPWVLCHGVRRSHPAAGSSGGQDASPSIAFLSARIPPRHRDSNQGVWISPVLMHAGLHAGERRISACPCACRRALRRNPSSLTP